MDVSIIPDINSRNESFHDYKDNMSSFLIVADFDFEDILKEYPDLLGNMENESKDWRPMTISLMVLYSIAFILGITGNIFVIAVVVQYKHMRTLTNVFLVNLTVGDLLVVLICIPRLPCDKSYMRQGGDCDKQNIYVVIYHTDIP